MFGQLLVSSTASADTATNTRVQLRSSAAVRNTTRSALYHNSVGRKMSAVREIPLSAAALSINNCRAFSVTAVAQPYTPSCRLLTFVAGLPVPLQVCILAVHRHTQHLSIQLLELLDLVRVGCQLGWANKCEAASRRRRQHDRQYGPGDSSRGRGGWMNSCQGAAPNVWCKETGRVCALSPHRHPHSKPPADVTLAVC
jgi:hypothetical protein